MATQAQMRANKDNSKKSTGPRSAEGKRIVSQNAVKHGLFSQQAVISGEDPAQFDLHRSAFLAELAPAGAIESTLAERIVGLTWRLRRAERMQNQAIDAMIEDTSPTLVELRIRRTVPTFLQDPPRPVPEPSMGLGRMIVRDCQNYRVLERLSVYERRIETSMLRAIRELERVQRSRKAEHAGAAEPSAGKGTPTDRPRNNLKKQSQFARALMSISSSNRKGYSASPPAGTGPNKAKQSQFETRKCSGPLTKAELVTALRAFK